MAEGAQESMVLTERQARTFDGLERMGACLSLVGVSLIFVSFAACKRLRNLPNTFIFCASVANVFASIACAIGYAGIWDLRRNLYSPLCQAQAFMFEWFMQSDPWWSVAMAINVFLVFFFGFRPDFFQRYLWVYCLICYGMPCIAGMLFLIYRHPTKGLIYGDAILWCWITSEWNYLRIASYYIPIWACITVSMLIYFAVGYHVFRQRNQLRNLTLSNPAKQVSTNGSSDVRDSAEKNLTSQPGYLSTITTEVQVTTDTLPPSSSDRHRRGSDPSATPPSPSPTNLTTMTTATISGGQSTVTWSPSRCDEMDIDIYPTTSSSLTANTISNFQTTSAIAAPAATHPASGGGVRDIEAQVDTVAAAKSKSSSTLGSRHDQSHNHSRSRSRHNNSWWTLVTGPSRAWHRCQQKLDNMDPVKTAYLRTSFIFGVSVLVTWTPSSINRVYSLIHPDHFSYGLNIAASVVLPLQGVWNAVIYFTTSWRVVREEWALLKARSRLLRRLGWFQSGDGGDGVAGGVGGGLGVPNMGRSRRISDNELELTPRVSTMRVVPGHGLDGGDI